MIPGTVYLLHLEPGLPITGARVARHYLGWTEGDIDDRLAQHHAGRGSPLVRAALAAGCCVTLERAWAHVDRHFERRLKRRQRSTPPLSSVRLSGTHRRARAAAHRPPRHGGGAPMLTDTHEPNQRAARSGDKAALRRGDLSIQDALGDPSEALSDLALWELLCMTPRVGRERIAKINRCAIQADINLALPLGRSSPYTRQWLTAALDDPQTAHRGLEPRPLVLNEDPRAEQLSQAITEHRAAIQGPQPTSEFGAADELLYHRCADIMADASAPGDEA